MEEIIMQQQKNGDCPPGSGKADREKPTPKSSHNPDWHYFWMTGLSSWGRIFQEEFRKENQKPLAEEESSFISKTMIFGVLLTFILLITTAGIQSANIFQAIQELGTNSVKQLMFTSK
jgi:hypothetical protein